MLTFLLWTMQNSDARARAAMQNFPGARARVVLLTERGG